ncbi:30S ribosomal protein S4e [Candidatus Woesearchaeota archaeon]|nr:MAG: 30S ribosomal protein S4e [Candidatus Woesearchaeota archaeon]
MLKYCKTTKEVKQILNNKEVLVDGKRRKDERFLVGLMDVITIPSTKESFRIVFSDKGHLSYVTIDNKESKFKLSKISGKTLIKGGKFQLNLSDARNINIAKNDYKVGDTLQIEVPSQKILKHFKLDVGSNIMLTGGSHVGKNGELKTIVGKTITFVTSQGDEFETKIEHAYVIGDKKSAIKTEE